MPSHVGQVIMSTTLDTAAKVKAIYGGTWEAWGKGKVPVGVDPNDTDFNAPNKSGGAKTVDLQHRHSYSNAYSSTYNNASGNKYTNGETVSNVVQYTSYSGSTTQSIMQPYQTLYMWIRTA